MARRWIPWVVLAVLVVGVVTWAAWPGGSQTVNERAHDLATQLKCPDCEGLSVADSNTSTAGAIRADIKRRVERGQSDSQIKQHFVDLYGESILLSPPGSGLGFLVWGLPVIALALGAVGLVIALRRWQHQPRMQATDADVALVEQARDRAS